MTSPGNALLHAITAEAYVRTNKKMSLNRRWRHLTTQEETTITNSYRRGYTQAELAHIYGVAQSTISRTITRQHTQRTP